MDAAQRVLIRAAQERMPGTPAVQAALERFAATFGDMELLLSGLRGHFDAVLDLPAAARTEAPA